MIKRTDPRILIVAERIERLQADDATSGDVLNLSEMIVAALDEYDKLAAS